MAGLHELVEAQVERTPRAVAVIDADGHTLTYRELDRRANQLAHHLRELGVVADTPVAVCVHRGLDLVIALCGILKAGGAYLPIDPDAPPARVRLMVAEGAAPVSVGEQALAHLLPGDLTRVVLLDRDSALIDRHPTTPADSGVRPGDLVSLYYTSGSTGIPKGVASTHGGWVNRMRWMQAEYRLEPGEAVLHKTTLSFDDSAVEVFWPLSTGGVVAILPPGEHRDPVALLEATSRFGAVVVQFVPSMLALFLAAHRRAGLPPLPHLRHVISSGEALTAPLALAFHEQIGVYGCGLHNQWGATEVSIDSTMYTYDPHDPHAGPVVSVGTPFTGNTVHVLDEAGDLVPDGAAGELFIGGIGLARGYHRRPALTAERFVPDPYGPPGSRLYRTGDLGRRRPDGALDFLGRTDHQVKIRGVRVELGEIEATLDAHPGVERSAVTVAGERLLGYVVASGAAPDPAELRAHLVDRLPPYLIPAQLAVIDRMPLTSSGKVDRAALPEIAPPAERAEGRPPVTAVQQTLATIWADVLDLDTVCLDDNFFELGGNSLLATQVMFRIQDDLRIDFPLYLLFSAESLEELAEEVAETRAEQLPPLPRVSREGTLPLSYGQERLWFLHRLAPGSTAYNVPTACRLHGHLDVAAFRQAFDELVARHEILRTRYVESPAGIPEVRIDARGPRLTVGVAPGQTRIARESAASDALQADWETPFDLAAAAPVRARLTRLDAYEHVFSLVVHHVAYDAASEQVLWQELATLYEAALAGRPAVLPEPAAQYVDYAAWQREHAAGGEQFDYWRGRLAGITPAELPVDRPRPPVQTYAGARVSFMIDERVTEELRRLGREAGTTLFAALLGAFQATLFQASGGADVAVGSPVPGRTRPETEQMIGFFVNTLVLRTPCGGDPTFVELLGRVREVVHGAYAHQDVPLERLVQALRPPRAPGRSPFFDVIFNGVPLSALTGAEGVRLPQLTVTPIDLATRTTVADLVCSVAETPDSIIGEVAYNTGLFDGPTVESLVDAWLHLLGAAVRDPHAPLSALSPVPHA
ncbi:amino acid adenylation domain-containing protein [Streptosporangium sp. NBC_01755]|uniref:amino acid adenylation domain-containing protein n=1 Tax=unclassified Streptosporangium TaxID=2632669 RepID=UPI002DDA1FBA|nr:MULTISPECIES: amino acid adenylation domain-containing protein [unclassified Streptosporangium]WSA28343.1 amino acid adenylation domain-containing protein [Streptosporangium sp. NBC_01810]WSD00179.1 amino acid adenylation domain-containing protein [Streptosporangium sp. NBC_01755]